VADAYDAMSSNRSYRTAIPQHLVREELVKGTGIQFDPGFARAMIHLLDLDVEYHMREKEKGANLSQETELRCENLYHDCTEGIPVTRKPVRIHLQSNPDEGCAEGEGPADADPVRRPGRQGPPRRRKQQGSALF